MGSTVGEGNDCKGAGSPPGGAGAPGGECSRHPGVYSYLVIPRKGPSLEFQVTMRQVFCRARFEDFVFWFTGMKNNFRRKGKEKHIISLFCRELSWARSAGNVAQLNSFRCAGAVWPW